MAWTDLPASAGWRHHEARDGFESVFFRAEPRGYRFDGHSVAVENGQAWSVSYTILLDERWTTKTAHIRGRSVAGERAVRLDASGLGRWEINGSHRPDLDGCFDVDLESSACTNTLPVRRLALDVGQSADAPAAYVRAVDLAVVRLEQEYIRIDDGGIGQRYDYRAPGFDFECRLVYDASGLVVEYPGIATRMQ